MLIDGEVVVHGPKKLKTKAQRRFVKRFKRMVRRLDREILSTIAAKEGTCFQTQK